MRLGNGSQINISNNKLKGLSTHVWLNVLKKVSLQPPRISVAAMQATTGSQPPPPTVSHAVAFFFSASTVCDDHNRHKRLESKIQ